LSNANFLTYRINTDYNIEETYITFGEFDRLSINKVTDITRYRDLSKKSKEWYGKRRSLLLYELEENNKGLKYNGSKEENFGFDVCDKKSEKKYLFLGLTLLPLSNNIKQQLYKQSKQEIETFNFKSLLLMCKNHIKDYIDKEVKRWNNSSSVKYEFYGTLGSAGLAIVWLTDQYDEVLYLVDKIGSLYIQGNKENKVFSSLFTIFSKNKIDDNKENKINEIRGTAQVHFTLRKTENYINNFINYLGDIFKRKEENLKYVRCCGEYDLILFIESKYIYDKFYKQKGKTTLSAKETKYKELIYQTKVILQREIEDIDFEIESTEPILPLSEEELDFNNDLLLKNSKIDSEVEVDINKIYNNLRIKLYDYFPKTAGMVDTLDLLYSDYKSNYYSINGVWANDFQHQFKALLEMISEITPNKEPDERMNDIKDTDLYLNLIRDVFDVMNHHIYHLHDSSPLLYIQVPPCHIKYTSSYDMLLHAYFGIVKSIIQLLYSRKKSQIQCELIPMITVDMVPVVGSEMYIELKKPEIHNIININLPSVALFDIPTYMPYVIHELSHYVTAKDRKKRNLLYGCIYMTEVIVSLLNTILDDCKEKVQEKMVKNEEIQKEIQNTKKQIYKIMIENTRPYIIYQVLYHYKKLHNTLMALSESDSGYNNNRLLLINYIEKLSNMVNSVLNYTDILSISNENLSYNTMYMDQWLNEVFSDLFENNQKEMIAPLEKLKQKQLEMQERDKGEYSAKIIGYFIDELKNLKILQHKTREEKFSDIYPRSYSNVAKSAYFYIENLMEVAADIPMIDICNMSVVEYLFSYAYVQENLLRKPPETIRDGESIRIGVALKYILSELRSANPPLDHLKILKSKKKIFIATFIVNYFSDYSKDYEQQKGNGKRNSQIKILFKTAEKWFDYYIEIYKHYIRYYSVYDKIFEEIIKCHRVQIEETKDIYYFKKYNKIRNEKAEEIIDLQFLDNWIENKYDDISENELRRLSEIEESYKSKMFKLNIDLALKFQYQISLKELKVQLDEINKKTLQEIKEKKYKEYDISELIDCYKLNSIEEHSNVEDKLPLTTYFVENFTDLMKKMLQFSMKLREKTSAFYPLENPKLWYRGHENSEWNLLPNLLRSYSDDYFNNKYEEYSLSVLLRNNIEKFKILLENSYEALDTRNYTIADYIATLQHYEGPTNYLDWSEDAICSLYFSLRNLVENNIDKRSPKDFQELKEKKSALYIFSPLLYNRARRQMIEKVLFNIDKQEYKNFMEKIKKTAKATGSKIPNLSMEYNQKNYNMFLLGSEELEEVVENFKSINDVDIARILFLPIAVATSQLNHRIQAQRGTFLAYNIYSPLYDNKFLYLALEEIQEYYLKNSEQWDIKDAEPFLYRIVLDNKIVKEDTAKWLRGIGAGADSYLVNL